MPPTRPLNPRFALGEQVAVLIEAEVKSLARRPAAPPFHPAARTIYTVSAPLADGTLGELRVEEFQLSSLLNGVAS